MATASTSRSPRGVSGAEINRAPAANRAVTAGWPGSDDSNTGASSPACTGRAAGSDQGTATGISSVYCTSPVRCSMASTGTSDGRRGSNKTTIIALVAPHLTLLVLKVQVDWLYQYLAAVFLEVPLPSWPPSEPAPDRGCAVRRYRPPAEWGLAPWPS